MRNANRKVSKAEESQTLNALILGYLRHVQFGTGYSKMTFKSYQSQLRRFDRWLGERLGRQAELKDVTARRLREYIVELSEGGRRPRTVRAAVMPIRSLFSYLVETEQLETSPIQSVRLPKKDPAHRPQVTDDELQALVAGCDRLPGTERPVMARAVLLTLITTAVRRSELLNLKVDDFLREREQLLVAHGKGAKSRAIFLTEETHSALEAWIEVRPRCRHDYLFVVDVNRRLGHLGLDTLLAEVKAAAGLKDHDNIQPHAIRHAAASRMQQRGVDLKAIQTVLGHANITTTAIYLHTDEAHLRSVAHLASLTPASPLGPAEPMTGDSPTGRAESENPPTPPTDSPRTAAGPSRFVRVDRRRREAVSPAAEEQPGRQGRAGQRRAARPVPWVLRRRERP